MLSDMSFSLLNLNLCFDAVGIYLTSKVQAGRTVLFSLDLTRRTSETNYKERGSVQSLKNDDNYDDGG